MSLHSSLLEMAFGNPEASKYNLVMDNDVVRICAEMAYNDVIMESFIEEETIITEGALDSFKENVKKIFDAVIGFIKSIWNKVVGFIKDVARKIRGEKSSSSSSGSSGSGGGSSKKSSGEKSDKKEEPKMVFHDWNIIFKKMKASGNNNGMIDVFENAEVKKFKNEAELESFKKFVDSEMDKPVLQNYKISEMDKGIKAIYEELVSKNEIESPLSAKMLQYLLDETIKELDSLDEVNKAFQSELKEMNKMFKNLKIEDVAKDTGEKYNEEEARLMMDGIKYTANKMKEISKDVAKYYVAGKQIDMDIIKNIRKEMKYAK